ncbi:alpha/beta hydrolase [Mycobacterium sp. 21AC1]|uniref:alpha/beta fold hydrolase n=1 Tax=[Mycobacterium] appelbergii TaxID=2939269 RepID=UPI002938D773|nr:alpha/beta hydrolase [Mycobacterium sp. 21AC1]MDV3127813.1 alpha/beta hydrolase [Mycobacterium sp. 21AC1]
MSEACEGIVGPTTVDQILGTPELKPGEQVITINGGNVVYEILGETGDYIALTPGGRFSKDIPGLRPLAEALVEGGYRVLLWDRPNCGRSDVQFYGQSESHMRAETLYKLITALDIGPCIIAGGSGGARDSMLTTMLYPEIVTKLVVWNIVGGVYGSFVLGSYYIVPSILAVRGAGMKAVARIDEWKTLSVDNPANRDRILALDSDGFLKLMLRWLNAFVPKPGQTIPGVEDEMFDNITVPTLIIRGGENDLDHPKRTSLEVSCLIKGSTLIDPPWPEDAWERAGEDRASGKAKQFNMFDTWVQAAPAILGFLR